MCSCNLLTADWSFQEYFYTDYAGYRSQTQNHRIKLFNHSFHLIIHYTKVTILMFIQVCMILKKAVMTMIQDSSTVILLSYTK